METAVAFHTPEFGVLSLGVFWHAGWVHYHILTLQDSARLTLPFERLAQPDLRSFAMRSFRMPANNAWSETLLTDKGTYKAELVMFLRLQIQPGWT